MPLVNSVEETAAPVASCGTRQIAEPASGRVVRTIAPGKGPVDSLACSPDGKVLYFAARGVIWGISSSGPARGGEARKIREVSAVVADPSGRRLIVEVQESSQSRFFSVPLDGGAEREISRDNSVWVAPLGLSSNALDADGRLLVPLMMGDSWFNPPGVIDTVTGRITRLPSDRQSDHQSLGWTPDGHVIALKIGLRATLWKFQPALP